MAPCDKWQGVGGLKGPRKEGADGVNVREASLKRWHAECAGIRWQQERAGWESAAQTDSAAGRGTSSPEAQSHLAGGGDMRLLCALRRNQDFIQEMTGSTNLIKRVMSVT